MILKRIGLTGTLVACALFAFPACETMYVGGGGGGYNNHPGPPAHAPAHGYKKKHHDDGPELVFDSGLGVYLVVGSANVYFDNDSYFRYSNGGWEFGVNLSGPWRTADYRHVPPGLHKKHGTVRPGSKGKGKGKGRGKGRYEDDDHGRGQGRGRDH